MSVLKLITYDDAGAEVKTSLPNPISMQWDMTDLEAEGCSGRNQLGEYFRDVISKKRTLSVAWGSLSDLQMKTVMEAFAEDSFVLEYPDAELGMRNKALFYINSRTAPMYSYTGGKDGQPDMWQWQGLSITFMEV